MAHAYEKLTHERVLDAVESLGLSPDGRLLALNSYENRVFQIGIEDGPGVVGKFYRPQRWSDAAIREEHRFSLDLAAAEVPVVPPLRFADETLFAHQGFRFTLFPRRGGRAPETDNLEHLEWIGRFIGRTHLLGQARAFVHRPRLDSQWYGWQARQTVLDGDMLPAEHAEHYRQLTTRLLEQVEQHFAQVQPAYLRLHGDCHPGNILWTDAGPHLVDMDDSCNGPAVQDLSLIHI